MGRTDSHVVLHANHRGLYQRSRRQLALTALPYPPAAHAPLAPPLARSACGSPAAAAATGGGARERRILRAIPGPAEVAGRVSASPGAPDRNGSHEGRRSAQLWRRCVVVSSDFAHSSPRRHWPRRWSGGRTRSERSRSSLGAARPTGCDSASRPRGRGATQLLCCLSPTFSASGGSSSSGLIFDQKVDPPAS